MSPTTLTLVKLHPRLQTVALTSRAARCRHFVRKARCDRSGQTVAVGPIRARKTPRGARERGAAGLALDLPFDQPMLEIVTAADVDKAWDRFVET